MAMFVNTNVSSLSGQRNLQNVTDRMNSSFEKLSSGNRINSARDDSAGLQIADRLTTQLTGLNQANRNANDGISIAQIAEGALGEITNNVQRMRQLVVQGGNRTLADDDRAALGDEFKQLMQTNSDIADRTSYGTVKLLNYDNNSAGFQVQSGAQAGEQDTITTGNAKLTSLFGDILSSENATGTLSGFMSTGLSAAGTFGKLVVANMVATNQSMASIAAADLLGVATLSAAAMSGAMISTLANNSKVGLDLDALTNLLTFNADAEDILSGGAGIDGNVDVILGLGTGGQAILGITSAQMNSTTGFTDAQLNTVNAFMTDTLMDMMSGLVTEVDKQRSKLGAEQNGLMSTVRSNTASIVNVSDSRARIMDTDFASETAELTRNQIIQQAATSILSQANQLPNAALSLLR